MFLNCYTVKILNQLKNFWKFIFFRKFSPLPKWLKTCQTLWQSLSLFENSGYCWVREIRYIYFSPINLRVYKFVRYKIMFWQYWFIWSFAAYFHSSRPHQAACIKIFVKLNLNLSWQENYQQVDFYRSTFLQLVFLKHSVGTNRFSIMKKNSENLSEK